MPQMLALMLFEQKVCFGKQSNRLEHGIKGKPEMFCMDLY